jgi:hypothetical protein
MCAELFLPNLDKVALEPTTNLKPAPFLTLDFQAKLNGFANIFDGRRLARALAHTAGDGRALGDPRAGFIAVKSYRKLHGHKIDGGRGTRKPVSSASP